MLLTQSTLIQNHFDAGPWNTVHLFCWFYFVIFILSLTLLVLVFNFIHANGIYICIGGLICLSYNICKTFTFTLSTFHNIRKIRWFAMVSKVKCITLCSLLIVNVQNQFRAPPQIITTSKQTTEVAKQKNVFRMK